MQMKSIICSVIPENTAILFRSEQRGNEKIYAFYCDIYDEAGGIATIATLLAMNSISIKNIGIIHNREFEEGVLRIEFYDEESCVKAQGVLKERNYTLHVR